MFLNASCPPVKLFVRDEFLYNLEKGHGAFTRCQLAGVCAIKNRIPSFHVLLENGAMYFRVPLHAFTTKKDAEIWTATDASFWDTLSYHISVTEFDLLKRRWAKVYLKDKTWEYGMYLFTIDYCEPGPELSAWAETADEHKCHHIIALENGNLIGAPNNRLLWIDQSFIEHKDERPDYKINTHIFSCEGQHSTDEYFYDVDAVKS